MQYTSTAVRLVSLGSFLAMAATAQAGVIADSVADFSGVQGHRGWTYGYYDVLQGHGPGSPGTFQPMTAFNQTWPDTWENPGSWALISDSTTHPHLPAHGRIFPGNLHTSRRWTSNHSGLVSISGTIHSNDLGGDGTIASIWVNGTMIQSWLVRGDVHDHFDYTLSNIAIDVGHLVEFVCDPRFTVDSDSTTFTGVITPSPAVASFLIAGSLCMRRRRR